MKGRPARPRLNSRAKVWTLNAVLGLGAAAIYALAIHGKTPPLHDPHVPWWLLAALSFITERWVVHLHVRRDAHSFSLGEIPLVVGLFLVSGPELLLAQLVGSGLALVQRGQSFTKLAFNLSNFALGTCVAIVLFRAVAPSAAIHSAVAWYAAMASTLAVMVLGVLAVFSAMALSGELVPFSLFPRVLGLGATVTAANTSLALISVMTIVVDVAAVWLLVIPTVIVFSSYRAYISERRKRDSLDFVYRSARVGRGATRVEAVVLELLPLTLEALKAEFAEVLITDDFGSATVGTMRVDAEPSVAFIEDAHSNPWWSLASRGESRVRYPTADESLDAFLADRGVREALVVPFTGARGNAGAFVVANPLGEIRSFGDEEVKLFSTIADHVSASFENVRLVENLQEQAIRNEHQALHDGLTGLPNRVLLRDRVEHAIEAASRANTSVAIMLMDLDRFKEINDSLGHHNGDLLLKELGERLREAVRRSDTVARLGGDEFAVLLPDLEDPDLAAGMAHKLMRAVEEPFQLDGMVVHADLSIGIAVHPSHGDDADVLLQRADVAMYLAKQTHTGYRIYAASADEFTPRRLALANALREAAHRNELRLVFQPKISLPERRLVGVEALARWHHPEYGVIMPQEFIALAENAGYIRTLTLHVLDAALAQWVRWTEDDLVLDISVNVSVRNLFDHEFPDQVTELLTKHGVPPKHLTLELTEDVLIADPRRVLEVLRRLKGRGVTLSIDDFGTGYSSLSYLSRLPVEELKIDKSFVMGMDDSKHDEIIVRSTIELAGNLGLRTVAEGVSSEKSLDFLVDLGCDIVQGFHVGKPMGAEDVPLAAAMWAEGLKGSVVADGATTPRRLTVAGGGD